MQTKFVEMANEAIAINANLLNKSTDYNVKAAKQAMQDVSEQTGEWFQMKTLDDYTALQGKVLQNSIEQVSNFTRVCVDLGFEAKDAYAALWQNYTGSNNTKKNAGKVVKVA